MPEKEKAEEKARNSLSTRIRNINITALRNKKNYNESTPIPAQPTNNLGGKTLKMSKSESVLGPSNQELVSQSQNRLVEIKDMLLSIQNPEEKANILWDLLEKEIVNQTAQAPTSNQNKSKFSILKPVNKGQAQNKPGTASLRGNPTRGGSAIVHFGTVSCTAAQNNANTPQTDPVPGHRARSSTNPAPPKPVPRLQTKQNSNPPGAFPSPQELPAQQRSNTDDAKISAQRANGSMNVSPAKIPFQAKPRSPAMSRKPASPHTRAVRTEKNPEDPVENTLDYQSESEVQLRQRHMKAKKKKSDRPNSFSPTQERRIRIKPPPIPLPHNPPDVLSKSPIQTRNNQKFDHSTAPRGTPPRTNNIPPPGGEPRSFTLKPSKSSLRIPLSSIFPQKLAEAEDEQEQEELPIVVGTVQQIKSQFEATVSKLVPNEFNSTLESSLEERSARASQIQQAGLAEVIAQKYQLEKRVTRLQADLESAQDQVTKLEPQVTTLERENQMLREEREHLANLIADLKIVAQQNQLEHMKAILLGLNTTAAATRTSVLRTGSTPQVLNTSGKILRNVQYYELLSDTKKLERTPPSPARMKEKDLPPAV